MTRRRVYSTFLLNEQPSVRRALPPVGWHNTVLQFPQSTTDCAWLKTVVLEDINKRVRIYNGSGTSLRTHAT